MKIFHIIGAIILFVIIIALMIMPTQTLHLQTELLSFNYSIPGMLTEEQKKMMEGKNFFQQLLHRWKYVYAHQLEAFWYRIALVGEAFLFGLYFYGQYLALLGVWLTSLILMVILAGYIILREILKWKKHKAIDPK